MFWKYSGDGTGDKLSSCFRKKNQKSSPSQHQWTDVSVDSEETLPDIIHGFYWIDFEGRLLPTAV